MNVAEFLAYWEEEGEAYFRRGDYAWMAAQVAGRRVLEIGCGPGFGTAALIQAGCQVLVVDTLDECLAAARQRCGNAPLEALQADVSELSAEARQQIMDFSPEAVVCWLMGAPAETTGATASDGGKAVAAYREGVHRAVAELAASLPAATLLHLVDRTAIPWQAKDIGRDTLVNYHLGKTLAGLPWQASRRDAAYRKLDGNVVAFGAPRLAHPSLRSVVPVLASLLVRRAH
ncbi:methyltransferase domain-containing protein [Dechloromonas sp. ZY10]|uniref:class I SAM-dependent methyltransferase n=1 Tax=Dechloromonas aquae TaxID=2664436 RepID=UPI003528E87F